MLCRGPSQAPEASVNRRPHDVDSAQRSAGDRTASGGLLSPSRVVPNHSTGTSPVRCALSGAVGTHHILQASLTVGPVDDPLEREADGIAALANVPRASFPAISPATANVVHCSCASCRDATPPSTEAQTTTARSSAPAAVADVLARPGRQLDDVTRAFFEPRFGVSLGHVRAHDDAASAASARALGARAYTVGSDIVFDGAIRPASADGRRLLAHELTHTIQQAGGAGVRVQRQLGSLTQQEDEKDPTCPLERPYRWGPKAGPGEAEPAVVSPCLSVPMPRPHQRPLQPDPTPVVTPPVEQTPPTTTTPAQTKEAPHLDQGTASPTPTPRHDEVTSTTEVPKGYQFDDDPLSEAGFGPNDATIRVRPGPVRTSLIRQRPTHIEWDCSFESLDFAVYGPKDAVDVERYGPELKAIFTRCPSAWVWVDAGPDPTQADPEEKAEERAKMVEDRLIAATGAEWENHFARGFATGRPGEIVLGLRRRSSPVSLGTDTTPLATPRRDAIDQWSAQGGLGGVRHFYTSAAGSAPLTEWLNQYQAALTKQYHGKDQSGEERQGFIQAQYSLTTRQWTLGFGGQESYVIALPANLQLSFWAQLMAGENITVGGTQAQLSAGSQFVWQPKDWLAVGAQAGLGPTFQSAGPNSLDLGGLIFIQIQQ